MRFYLGITSLFFQMRIKEMRFHLSKEVIFQNSKIILAIDLFIFIYCYNTTID